jgi:hypothetical protein
MSNRTVAVDFDGVIHSYTRGWTGYTPRDAPEPGALEFVQRLLAEGFDVVVMTTRAATREGLFATRDWLVLHGFPDLRVTDQKIPAIAYVDDRAVSYRHGASWDDVRAAVLELTPNHLRRG